MKEPKPSRRTRAWFLLVGCQVALLVGCNRDRELTRSAAKELIARSPRFTPVTPSLNLSPAELECGLKQGLWVKAVRKQSVSDIWFGFHLEVTAKGKAGFDEVSPSSAKQYPARATLNKQCSRKVLEVTGISDYAPPLEGSKGKEVQFSWKWTWDDFPDVAKRCLAPRPEEKATAVFRHYDDNWRVEEIPADQF
jgi:hypothetical protein